MTTDRMLSDDASYLALTARDARVDGRFFTGVTSTGIYCRPVCSVKTPRRENCRFFRHAAEAESAAFRPCLRCRPELAPHSVVWSIQDASYILAHQAARLLGEPDALLPADPGASGRGPVMTRLAARLGVSSRHVRRIFESQLGVSPLQYLQTRRLHTAKQLLTDTALPVMQIAGLSGYASVRRFNTEFLEHYRMSPGAIRRNVVSASSCEGTQASPSIAIRLGYRPPYDVQAMLGFFARRMISGIECMEPGKATDGPVVLRTLRLELAGKVHRGWLRMYFDEPRSQLVLQVSDTLLNALPLVIRRVRACFDLDADPAAINSVLKPCFPGGDGLRVPGTLDGYELAVRAVLGQQITVAAARTLAQRMVDRFGEPIKTPWPTLNRLFHAAAVLAEASADALGELGIVRQRQAAIIGISRAVASGQLQLHPAADVGATLAQLTALPGIGDWTAQYIAMRALRWPDAFPAGDVAMHKMLGVQGLKSPARLAEQASSACGPGAAMRSFACGAGSGTLLRQTRKQQYCNLKHTMKYHPCIVQTRFDSPLGVIIVAASPARLAGLWFDGQRHLPTQVLGSSPAWPADDGHPVLRQTCLQLGQYFAGQRSSFDIAPDLSGGTPFQQAVWQALQAIRPGATTSYGEIARMVGRPAAVRAVGAAIGRNPVSIIVPCHRVLGAGGALTGYAGGIERKKALLRLEKELVTAAPPPPTNSCGRQAAACQSTGA